jgi:hypothetical protein
MKDRNSVETPVLPPGCGLKARLSLPSWYDRCVGKLSRPGGNAESMKVCL